MQLIKINILLVFAFLFSSISFAEDLWYEKFDNSNPIKYFIDGVWEITKSVDSLSKKNDSLINKKIYKYKNYMQVPEDKLIPSSRMCHYLATHKVVLDLSIHEDLKPYVQAKNGTIFVLYTNCKSNLRWEESRPEHIDRILSASKDNLIGFGYIYVLGEESILIEYHGKDNKKGYSLFELTRLEKDKTFKKLITKIESM